LYYHYLVPIRRTKPKGHEVLIGSGLRPEEELQFVVWALNGDDLFTIQGPFDDHGRDVRELRDKLLAATPQKLQHLVETWNQSGRDLKRMWGDSYVTALKVNQFYKDHPLQMGWEGSGKNVMVHTFLDCHCSTPSEEALRFFLTLIFNPLKNELCGPCGECGRYYIRRTAKNDTYCSRSCGARKTAIATTKRKRAEEHADKLQRARVAIEQWREQRLTGRARQKDWKRWVSTVELDISPHFLTRAVNKGELKLPVRQ
jgi:hypothetical protein